MSQPIVVMGVSGSGKTTLGAALARRLGVPFADADDFHPPANIAKMAAGTPLDDADRAPWLAAIAGWLADHADGGVVTCSALKRVFRDRLRAAAPAVFVHLAGDPDVVRARVAARPGHFMPVSLVASQFAALEPLDADEPGVVLDLDRPVEDLVTSCLAVAEGLPT
ncbi:Gluconokinase [Actinosynnema sp. ALI-1.44]|nr:gluconokinase [Saccharothrix mutabilis subsp. capreolus]